MAQAALQDGERLRKAAMMWLVWTGAGLFYAAQGSVARLYRNEIVPWQGLVAGWFAAMYSCAAFAPAILRLGRRWSRGARNHRRREHAGSDLCDRARPVHHPPSRSARWTICS